MLRFVSNDFGELQIEATPLMCVNSSAIAITKNHDFRQKTKYIDSRYHIIRDALHQRKFDCSIVLQMSKLQTYFPSPYQEKGLVT